MDYEIAEVVVKERVYRELGKQGLDTLEYSAEVSRGRGEYGTYSGDVVHLTVDYGPVPCGSFEVSLFPGEYFPEVDRCSVRMAGDQEPYRRIWTRQEV